MLAATPSPDIIKSLFARDQLPPPMRLPSRGQTLKAATSVKPVLPWVACA